MLLEASRGVFSGSGGGVSGLYQGLERPFRDHPRTCQEPGRQPEAQGVGACRDDRAGKELNPRAPAKIILDTKMEPYYSIHKKGTTKMVQEKGIHNAGSMGL